MTARAGRLRHATGADRRRPGAPAADRGPHHHWDAEARRKLAAGRHPLAFAQVHTLSGYSAHADQQDLLHFIGRMRQPPRQVRLVHGDEGAKQALAALIRQRQPGTVVVVP